MPLFIGNEPYTKPVKDIQQFFQDNDTLREKADLFRSREPVVVTGPRGLYVHQREHAVIATNDETIDFIGTDDATTCHMIVIKHTASGFLCLAHCDGNDTRNEIKRMMDEIKQLSGHSPDGMTPDGRFELILVGGFLDERKCSEELSRDILSVFQSCDDDVHLVEACITHCNNVQRNNINFPVVYGIAVRLASGEVFPANFPDKGPAIDVRSASHFVGKTKMRNVYDSDKKQLVIGPFEWACHSAQRVSGYLALTDAQIRQYLSTSPEQEPEGFESHVRDALRVLHKNPQPSVSLFPNNTPWRYQQDDTGIWTRIEH